MDKRARRKFDEHDRLTAINSFYQFLADGDTQEEAAKKAGASVSSIYRWQHDDGDPLQPLIPHDTAVREASAAIRCLCTPESDQASRRRAILDLALWMRWPSEVDGRSIGRMSLALSYFQRQTGAQLLSELPEPLKAEASAYVDLGDMARLCTPYPPATVYFHYGRIDEQPYTDRDVLGQLGWYFLSSHAAGERPSIAKAHRALENNGFRYKWSLSFRAFWRFWKSNVSAIPFLYVEQSHTALDWNLDPTKNDFTEQVDELLASPAIPEFLGRCRWATELFASILDRRAAENVLFPAFPRHLEPIPCKIEPITAKLRKAADSR